MDVDTGILEDGDRFSMDFGVRVEGADKDGVDFILDNDLSTGGSFGEDTAGFESDVEVCIGGYGLDFLDSDDFGMGLSIFLGSA